ncbi:MAG: methyltransferase domain-containing protein [Rhodospirillaceae bacterium]
MPLKHLYSSLRNALNRRRAKIDFQIPLRLHVGGHEAKKGWVIFNAENGPLVDIVGTCTDMSLFPDHCCSDIYCSHVIEHLSLAGELTQTLNEFYRILAPGGVLRVSVPDVSVLFRFYNDPRSTAEVRLELLKYIYGGQTSSYDFHKWGFDAELMHILLKNTGFEDIEQVRFFGFFDDSSELMMNDIPLSVNMVAKKGA